MKDSDRVKVGSIVRMLSAGSNAYDNVLNRLAKVTETNDNMLFAQTIEPPKPQGIHVAKHWLDESSSGYSAELILE